MVGHLNTIERVQDHRDFSPATGFPPVSMWGGRAALALVAANARYWPTVLPRVHRELRRWESRARSIPDPALRAVALEKLRDERFNTEVAATLATISPRRYRGRAIEAIVALQVMYDYLDGIGEQPTPDPLEDGRQLFRALANGVEIGFAGEVDYYRHHLQPEDGGYLKSLAAVCREAFVGLPQAAVVAPTALRAAERCGEGQARTHAIERFGVEQLAVWAAREAEGTSLAWWEFTAGATASVLAMHALIAAAADPRIDSAEARRIDDAYLRISAVSTLLDSLIDLPRDAREGGHSFVGYFEDEAERSERLGRLAAAAATAAPELRHGAHHYMTTVGVAAYYLSAPEADEPYACPAKASIVAELRPLIAPTLGIFHLWRMVKRLRARR
jgi:tetraprenyl-beta-curcumene synthase